MSKRPAQEIQVGDDGDVLTITPLGSGMEVGRSCVLLQFKGKTVMFDCGIHPAKPGQVRFFRRV